MRKALSLFLAAIMLLTMIPMGAIGIFAEENVVEVGSVEQWNAAVDAGGTFEGKIIKLTADFGGTPEEPAALKSVAQFKGELDGNGKTISNVTLTNGFFTQAVGTTSYHDLTVVNAKVTGNDHLAIMVRDARNTVTFENITLVDCALATKSPYRFGGLIGSAYDGIQLTIDNCDVEVDIAPHDGVQIDQTYGAGIFVGLIYAYNSNTVITNSSAKGHISGYGKLGNVGGIIGNVYGSVSNGRSFRIENVSVEAVLDTTGYAGGIFGHFGVTKNSVLSVKNAEIDVEIINTGLKTEDAAKNCAGLLFGYGGGYSTEDGSFLVENVKATGSVTAANAGGVYGMITRSEANADKAPMTFKGLDIDAEVNGSLTAGGFAGTVGEGGLAHAGGITLENSVIAGTVNIPDESTVKAGALIGVYGYGSTTLNVNNTVITASVEGADGLPNLIVADTNAATNSTIALSGCVTNYGEEDDDYVIGGVAGAVTGTVAYANNTKIDSLIERNEDNFITFIGLKFNAVIEGQTKAMAIGYSDKYVLPTAKSKGKVCVGWKVNGATEVTPVGEAVATEGLTSVEAVFDAVMSKAWIQLKNNTNNTQDIRVVGLIDSIRYAEIGYNVTIKYTEGGQQKTKTQNGFKINNVYESLTAAYGTEVITTETLGLSAGDGYLTSFVIKNVPTNVGQVVIELTPYQVQLNGTETTGQMITITLNNGVA